VTSSATFGGFVAREINEVTSHCVADSVGVDFVFPIVCHCSDIGGDFSTWYVLLSDELACGGALYCVFRLEPAYVALEQSAYFFAHRYDPPGAI
jgi:hypothetical protein